MGNVQVSEENRIEEKKTIGQDLAGIILAFCVFLVISYTVSITFHVFSFISAFILAGLTIYSTPDIIRQLIKTPVLTYYSIFLTITLFLSVNDYKYNSDMMLLLVTHVLVCVGVFLTDNKYIAHFFIFTNFYIVLRIFTFFNSSPVKDDSGIDYNLI